jgi:hypothetical protein
LPAIGALNETTMSSPTAAVDAARLIVGASSHAASPTALAVSPLRIKINFECMTTSLGAHATLHGTLIVANASNVTTTS